MLFYSHFTLLQWRTCCRIFILREIPIPCRAASNKSANVKKFFSRSSNIRFEASVTTTRRPTSYSHNFNYFLLQCHPTLQYYFAISPTKATEAQSFPSRDEPSRSRSRSAANGSDSDESSCRKTRSSHANQAVQAAQPRGVEEPGCTERTGDMPPSHKLVHSPSPEEPGAIPASWSDATPAKNNSRRRPKTPISAACSLFDPTEPGDTEARQKQSTAEAEQRP